MARSRYNLRVPSTRPRVSVVIPTYNRAGAVCEAVQSALDQTYSDLEVIVVDDGSTDDTAQRVGERFGGDARVVLVSQPHSGPGAARNRGIERARGELIAFLDSDDVWYPEKLELQLRRLDESGAALVFSDFVFPDGVGERTRFQFTGFAGDTSLRGIVEKRFPLCTPAVVARRRDLQEAGLFDESLPCAQDWDLWIRLIARRPAAYVERPLGRVRRAGDNLSYSRLLEKWECWLRVWEKNEALLLAGGCSRAGQRRRRAHAHKKIAQLQRRLGNYPRAREHYLRWWRLAPWQPRGLLGWAWVSLREWLGAQGGKRVSAH